MKLEFAPIEHLPEIRPGMNVSGCLRDALDKSGLKLEAGDIVAADGDGVVVVPRGQAAEVLAKAQQLDFQEHSMYGYIEKYKSIVEAVKQFGRL